MKTTISKALLIQLFVCVNLFANQSVSVPEIVTQIKAIQEDLKNKDKPIWIKTAIKIANILSPIAPNGKMSRANSKELQAAFSEVTVSSLAENLDSIDIPLKSMRLSGPVEAIPLVELNIRIMYQKNLENDEVMVEVKIFKMKANQIETLIGTPKLFDAKAFSEDRAVLREINYVAGTIIEVHVPRDVKSAVEGSLRIYDKHFRIDPFVSVVYFKEKGVVKLRRIRKL